MSNSDKASCSSQFRFMSLDAAAPESLCMACLHSGVVGSELTKDACPVRVHVLCSKCVKAFPECILCARANEVHSLFPVADQMLRELQSFSFAEQQEADRKE